MIIFNVVKERFGWAIQIGKRTTSPFRLRELAVREAHCLADAIRRHGERAEVIVESTDPNGPPQKNWAKSLGSSGRASAQDGLRFGSD